MVIMMAMMIMIIMVMIVVMVVVMMMVMVMVMTVMTMMSMKKMTVPMRGEGDDALPGTHTCTATSHTLMCFSRQLTDCRSFTPESVAVF